MKKNFLYTFLLLSMLAMTACDEGFDDLNINQTAATSVNPVFLLNNAVINSSFVATTVQYEIGIVQQMISPNSGVLTGANFNQDNRDATQASWQRYYRSTIRNTVDALEAAKNLPTRTNLYNMSRIWLAHAFMVMTDTYGDVPYTEAGKGYIEQVLLPKYDSQQSIYTALIKELTEATAALDASKTVETADVLYGGNITQWKKLGNSLLLRAGMRLVKVDAALAQSTVQKALQGALIDANADNCVIRHDANYVNGIGQMLNSTEANNFYLAKPFADHLKNTSDPRLGSIAVRYVGAKSGPEQSAAKANIDPAVQIGMPLGFDNSGIVAEATKAGLASFYDFSQVDRTRMVKNTAPMFLVTAAQTQLLVAEAIQRGWGTGNIEQTYQKAIRLHMEQMALYDARSAIASSAIDAYLTANPFDASKALEQINTQYWIASFLNGPEAFANFRRSGFPVLAPNPFPGKAIKGAFIRRLTYPNSEISVNKANVDQAVGRQGADDLDSRVWWDK
ncbi:MAG: SusD/RagB family nutrient-binding outer membrane lipoprotein [Haliscomenobacter sp.]|uniref:SusD/RagB family nutrient-binding outer membrane lipoprotein n=1 Tax=Haliscomenobacter sp. TaxID=2717303 RepID=UPI0029AE680A|nr:SusD/RagB family nutrient-binding outer membrane lipoprotein [Haliscomenobacter sp.]MDX2070413.1 SusD/RagB family nutrient-binding outer membrane lipoprotein [Haliscomenobacter sp.]